MDDVDESVEETLVEMAYRWADIEEALPRWHRPAEDEDGENEQVGAELAGALDEAFRVEAACESGVTDFGRPWAIFRYELLFDVERKDAREGAQSVRTNLDFLGSVVRKLSGGEGREILVRVVSAGIAAEGQVCGRPFEPPPKAFMDVADVPEEKPESNVPLEKIDGYWLTPIEVPFYRALRETGLVFAVQPWIQGVERRSRLDFLIFYDGGMVAVELDGHESHKTKDQRLRDARRDRWFQGRKVRTLRWTGSEVHANPQECVRELLDIVRGRQARA